MSKLSRRAFLGGVLTTVGVAGCSQIIDEATHRDIPDVLRPPTGTERHPIAHLLSRATYGPLPGQIRQVERMGRTKWLEQQLDYRDIDDLATDLKLRRFDTLEMNEADLKGFNGATNRDYVRNELAAATLVRAVFSNRELYEVMVGFWSDHFSLYHYKGEVSLLKTVDDREVIRRHAMGKFSDLLWASAHSPAMLTYLDNILNEKSHPNENYAREIMELHTLGVDGGYTEQDIKEVARCFTGWSTDRVGRFTFVEAWHDDGEKVVLGEVIPAGGGQSDGERVLEILLAHPSTARYVSTKLVRRMVADDPPPTIVDACVDTWQASDGDIRALLRTIFNHPDFETAPPKLKRPFELLTSMLRATNAKYDGSTDIINRLEKMGHRPFGWATPDGYPDTAQEWAGNLLGRWNLALDLLELGDDFASRLPGIALEDLEAIARAGDADSLEERLVFYGQHFLKRSMDATQLDALNDYLASQRDSDQLNETLALLLASPAFQWR